MLRRELFGMFVLNTISDDYEDLHQITKWVTNLCSRSGLFAEPSEILRAIEDLIDAGLAKAYRLSNGPPEVIDGMPPADEIGSPFLSTVDDLYFYVTEEGRERAVQLWGHPDWPFDGDEQLRPDWSPPVA